MRLNRSRPHNAVTIVLAAALSALIGRPLTADVVVAHGHGRARRKEKASPAVALVTTPRVEPLGARLFAPPTQVMPPSSPAAFAPAVAIVPMPTLADRAAPADEARATPVDEARAAPADEARAAPADEARAAPADVPPSPALAATLVQTHTDERVILDARSPSDARFEALLADRVTGAAHRVDPRLLALLRSLVATFAKEVASAQEAPRIEIVSGFRSPKLNEMLRKKGHHVASHSQHSLGQAIDFRVGLADHPTGDRIDQRDVDPRELEKRVRALGWVGGVGVYLSRDDWFVHCDVGPNRRWLGK